MSNRLTENDLWRLVYLHGPITMSIGEGHSTVEYIIVNGLRYRMDDPADLDVLHRMINHLPNCFDIINSEETQ